MADPLYVENDILINAPVPEVWDALVNPEQTKKYMFGCEAISDWKPGSSLDWKGIYEGQEMIFVKGEIVAIEENSLLKYTTIDPNSEMDATSENYLIVTYELMAKGNQTRLHVRQGDYSTVAAIEKRYQETYNNGEGWNPILVEIKKLLEGERKLAS